MALHIGKTTITKKIQRNLQEKNQRGKIRDYTLSFTVPKENDKCENPVVENVKNAMFEAGAGYVGKNEKGKWLCSNSNKFKEDLLMFQGLINLRILYRK